MIEHLKELRKVARRMQESYLRKHNFYDFIMQETAGDAFAKFNMRERVDYILAGKPDLRCHCGNLLKVGAKNCSSPCTGKNPENRQKSSLAQQANAAERWEKTQQTNLRKYGVYHNNHVPECNEKRKRSRQAWCDRTVAETFRGYGLDIELYNSKEKLEQVISEHNSLEEISKTLNGMPIMTVYRHMARYDVGMYEKQTSGGERELLAFVDSLGLQTKTNDRTIIKPLELDIVVPDSKIAIEFDGIYWHSEKAAKGAFDPKKHLKKTQACSDAGYKLIHVFENEWKLNRDICKSVIAAKLGIFSRKIFARKCKVELVDPKRAKEFFERTHIQGWAQASVSVGLFLGEELVLCCSFGKPRFSKESDWELIRFSSALNTNVIGGFGKALQFFKRNYSGTIMTYCDLKYSTGGTYAKFGTLIRQTAPGYSWCSLKSPALSRYQTQKHKLKRLFPVSYSEDKTENQILEANGYFKLYDCGNLVFEL